MHAIAKGQAEAQFILTLEGRKCSISGRFNQIAMNLISNAVKYTPEGGSVSVTTEVVRLRGAVAHNCRLCKSLRESTALDAGGTESMSQAPLVLRGARFGHPLGRPPPLEDALWAALTDTQVGLPMGMTAELVKAIVRSQWVPPSAEAQR